MEKPRQVFTTHDFNDDGYRDFTLDDIKKFSAPTQLELTRMLRWHYSERIFALCLEEKFYMEILTVIK